MENTELGRKVVDLMDTKPELFNMDVWGEKTECGTIACLAGHTMIFAGYRLRADEFFRPDGTQVDNEGREAERLLGMTGEEVFDTNSGRTIWYDWEAGPDRFRKVVEESEGQV